MRKGQYAGKAAGWWPVIVATFPASKVLCPLGLVLLMTSTLGACGTTPSTAVISPNDDGATTGPTTTTRSGTSECPPLPPGGDDLFAEGQILEASHKTDSDGKEAAAQRLYRSAAKSGHLKAQATSGLYLFGVMFINDDPSEAQKDDYVEALTNVFTAAARGDAEARSGLPGIAAIIDSGVIPGELEMPLADVPRAWIEEALARSRAWLECYQ